MDHRPSLLFHLGQAQSKISSLEEYIREREKQIRSAVNRFERSESRSMVAGGRLRRAGLSHNLLHMRTMSQEEEELEEMDTYSRPLANFASLKIVRVLSSPDSDEAPPFSLQRFVSREYHISEDGILIGHGKECGVVVPLEAGLEEKHLLIKWIPAVTRIGEGCSLHRERRGSKLMRQEVLGSARKHSGHYELHDLSRGRGGFRVSHDPTAPQHSTITEQESEECEHTIAGTDNATPTDNAAPTYTPSDTPLDTSRFLEGGARPGPASPVEAYQGIRFIASRLEFSLTALPMELLYTLRMFAATKKGDLDELRDIVESSKSSDLLVPYVTVSQPGDANASRFSMISVTSNQGVDINAQYQPPAFSDDVFFGQNFNRRRSSLHMAARTVTLLSPGSSMGVGQSAAAICGYSPDEHKLLLHIAIGKGYLEIVTYLLSQNANVNLCAGELSRSALHLAAQKNLPHVMLELLRYGGDVEVRDALHLQPLALTSDYRVRKLLINTVLLCAAAEEGDQEEAERLLLATPVSPNARGLKHKNALHLAASKGHREIVEILLLNGADVNSKGGTRLRTPLHYASLNDHVEVAQLLLEAGANEFARDSGGYTPLNLSMGGKMCKLLHKEPLSLCLAVQSGDVESVKRLLLERDGWGEEGGFEGDTERAVDQRNEQSHAPLHLACTSGNVEMVRVLVAHGASIGLRGGSDSWTPLMYAAMAGHSKVVKFLLSVGADSQEVDEHECSAGERVEQALEETKGLLQQLESKIRNQSLTDTAYHTLEPASMLRQESGSSFSPESEKAWLKNRYDRLQKTLLVLTSGLDRMLKCIDTNNHTEFVDLLDSGVVSANTMIDKHSPSSALVRVCENGLYQFAKTLIEHGAEINQVGSSDQIPILVAAASGNVDLVKLLHDSGASIDVQSEDTLNTPLHEAATENNVGCVAYLLSVGACLNVCNASGETPFDSSTQHEVKSILAVGPNKLLLAASIGDCQEIQRLINEEGLSPCHVYPRGVTALHEASEAGYAEATKLLIDSGADVNKQLHASMVTALHLASQNNHIEIARLLIAAGAKLDLKDMDGKVPFEVARSNPMRKVLVESRTVHAQPVSRENSTTERRCMICMDNPINTIILPCGHEAFCTNCVSRITTCALDRQAIREVLTIYK